MFWEKQTVLFGLNIILSFYIDLLAYFIWNHLSQFCTYKWYCEYKVFFGDPCRKISVQLTLDFFNNKLNLVWSLFTKPLISSLMTKETRVFH